MKNMYLSLLTLLVSSVSMAQNPGLVISEVYVNPSGTDNSFEWVELIATQAIDFSITPYSVVVCNNGTANVNGWIAGANLSYGFAITTGSVVAGDVVYVGGSTMAPTGTKLRVIDVVTTPGDGFGNAAAGVFGNGGANADGVAVFNLPIGSVTNSTVPVDAVFYGTGIGTALVNGGADGFQLPVNDRYTGGKLQTTSFFAGDPGSDISIRATGFFNTSTNMWYGQRSWTTQNPTNNNTSLISLGTVNPPGTASISLATQTVAETAGNVTVQVNFANPNENPAKIVFERSVYSNATFGSDYSWTNDTLTIPANSSGNFPFVINLTDDVLAERSERIIVKLKTVNNALIASNNFQIIYLTDNDYQNPTATNELSLNLLTSFSNGSEGTNSAEIVSFDPSTDRLYIANSIGAKMDIVDFANPSAPILLNSISMTPYGNINSIAVHNGVIAVAMENTNPQLNGSVVFFDGNGVFINQVTVGAMPDMITYNNDYTKILVACEGEPISNYTIDPEGSIAIIDLLPGVATITNANVTLANFNAFNGQEATLRSQGIRIFGPGSSVSQDLEPEYITLSEDNTTAYVSLQENNAMAVVNIATATVTAIRPLGFSDYSTNNGLDASDQTAGIYIGSIPAKGAFMPDALAHATIGGVEYLFSANEGDAREYTAVTDVARLGATSLDPTVFPDQNILKSNQFLGRLNMLQATGDTDNDGDKDEIHLLGSRSFSIWNAQTGALVYDSKDLIEQLTATHPSLAGLFNASNSAGAAAAKNRSDDKGPEPEGVATAIINGKNYLFVSLERVGGVLLFNIENPAIPVYVGYYNNRTAASNGPDRGAEGIIVISKTDSPSGKELVLLANEVSSTVSVFEVNTCVDLAGATIIVPTDSICAGTTVQLTVPGNAQSTIQWLQNNQPINGANGNTISVNQTGNYRVYVSNSALACSDTTQKETITVLALPQLTVSPSSAICLGDSIALTASGATTISWNNSVSNTVPFAPNTTDTYTITGTDAFGCQNAQNVTVTVNPLPIAVVSGSQSICAGETVVLTATGGSTISWNNGVSNQNPFTPLATQTYTATVVNSFGCTDTAQVMVVVNALPTVVAPFDTTICFGEATLFNATGAANYVWSNGISNGNTFTPVNTASYSVIGTDVNGCENSSSFTVTVLPKPVVQIPTNFEVCAGTSVTLNASGALQYNWDNGIQNGVSFDPNVTSTYTVIGLDAFGCSDTASVEVVVNANPIINLGSDTTACVYNGNILLDAGANYQSYEWNTNATTQTVSAFISGLYEVTVTDNNGCEGTDAILVTFDPCLGIAETTIDFTVFPNPSNGMIHIRSLGEKMKTLTVVASNGQIVYANTLNNTEETVDLTNNANGIYTMILTFENGMQQQARMVISQ